MEPDKLPQEKLSDKLKNIESAGIQADRLHLKKNMCTQFADYFEFIREYVVNAYDAMATYCLVRITESQDTLTVTITDNGKGMNLSGLKDFLTIFRSRKHEAAIKPVGRHGIGKLSAAAIPGLILYKVCTSTGKECFDFETDSLLDDRQIIIRKNSLIQTQGTSFEITFKKNMTANQLTTRLYDILYKYIRYLPIAVQFEMADDNAPGDYLFNSLPRGEWTYPEESYGRSYNVVLRGKACEVVMGVGNGVHEIFQNRVFIGSRYDLFNYGLQDSCRIPNLMIRADSEAFELPFGRHCLCNEDILAELSAIIRNQIVPEYFTFLTSHFGFNTIKVRPVSLDKTDEMTIGLLTFSGSGNPWTGYPVFRSVEGKRLSMEELRNQITLTNRIYIEAKNSEGIDYSEFKASVLALEQADGALRLLEDLFPDNIINLNSEDIVLEMPPGEQNKLTTEEQRFESYLGYKPVKVELDSIDDKKKVYWETKWWGNDKKKIRPEDCAGICEEAKTAENDLSNIKWRVGYLVEKDAKTPCTRKKFMYRNNLITLNLFHPEIREFVHLSVINPDLSAHWAIAMCLADNNILSHITPEAREDLLILDAISRIGYYATYNKAVNGEGGIERELIDFMRNCMKGGSRSN